MHLSLCLTHTRTESSALGLKTQLEYLSHIPTLKGGLSCQVAPLGMPNCTTLHAGTQSEVL